MWGQGVPIDYPRGLAAYKVGAEGGLATCQWQVGYMYYYGRGVDVDYAQAVPWIEKAAAQDHTNAIGQLGMMYVHGEGGVTPSCRRALDYTKRAIELGSSGAVVGLQTLTESISEVTMTMTMTTQRGLTLTLTLGPSP